MNFFMMVQCFEMHLYIQVTWLYFVMIMPMFVHDTRSEFLSPWLKFLSKWHFKNPSFPWRFSPNFFEWNIFVSNYRRTFAILVLKCFSPLIIRTSLKVFGLFFFLTHCKIRNRTHILYQAHSSEVDRNIVAFVFYFQTFPPKQHISSKADPV